MSYGKPQSKGVKSDFGKVATIRHLTRIITYLSEVDRDSISNISKNACVNYCLTKGAMVFLVNHGIVIKKKDLRRKPDKRWGNMWYYSLNKKNSENGKQTIT